MNIGQYNLNGDWKPYLTERRNFLFLGKRGTGKTETLTQLALDDIHAGESVTFFGNITPILERIPASRIKDTIVFNPALSPFALNFFHNVPPELHSLLSGALTEAVKSIWFRSDVSTANVDQYLRASIQTLLAVPDSTFLHIEFLLTDRGYRTQALKHVSDPALLHFWRGFDDVPEKDRAQRIESTLNKLRTIAFEPLVRNCIGQEQNSLSFTDTIVLIELPEHRIGRENASLLGTLILAYLSALGVRTHLYVDGVARFGISVVKDILSSGIPTCLTLKYLGELDEPDLLLGAVDETVAFRTTVKDAKVLEPEYFLPTQEHLHSIPDFHAYFPEGSRSELLRMNSVEYPKTRCSERILRRNRAEHTTRPTSAIEKRVGRYFADV